MPSFPNDPTENEQVVLGGVTYSWTGVAWKIVAGAGSVAAGGDTDNIQFHNGATLAGTDDFRWDNTDKEFVIGAAPSGTTHAALAGHVKFYAEEHTDDVGEVLLRLDEDLTSAGSATTTVTEEGGPGAFDLNNFRYGTASYKFTSSGEADFLKVSTTTNAELKWTGAFTVDLWFKLLSGVATSGTEDKCFFSQENLSGGAYVKGIAAFYRAPGHGGTSGAAGGDIRIRVPNTAGTGDYDVLFKLPSAVTAASLENEFNHLAVIRTGVAAGGLAVYLNGNSLIPSTTSLTDNGTGTCNPDSNGFTIGRFQGDNSGAGDTGVPTADDDFDGWMDEIRIMNEAAYTADFTPKGAPYSDTPYTRVYAKSSDGTTSELTTVGNTDNWTNDVTEATLDGVVALKSIESSPYSAPNHTQIYSLDVPGLITDADIYIPGTESDLSLNVGTSDVGCYHTNLQANTNKPGPTGLDDLLPLRWPAGFSDAPSAVYIDDHADTRFDGEFAIDFWYRHSPAVLNWSDYRGALIGPDKSRNLNVITTSLDHAFLLNHEFNSSGSPIIEFSFDELTSTGYNSNPPSSHFDDGDQNNTVFTFFPNDFIGPTYTGYQMDTYWNHVAITRDSAYRMHVFYNGYCVRTNTQVANDVSYSYFGYPDEATVDVSNLSDPYIGEGTGWKFGHAYNKIVTQVGTNQNEPQASHSGWMCGFRFKKGADRGWNITDLSNSMATPPNDSLDDRAYFNPPTETLSIPTAQLYTKSEGGTLTPLSNPGFKREGSNFATKTGVVTLSNAADLLEFGQNVDASALPTAEPTETGRLWVSSGTVKVS